MTFAAFVVAPRTVNAHEIPASVIVRMTVQQEPTLVRVNVRVPLESIRDIDFPLAPGTQYVDFARADSLTRQAVETWILPYFFVRASGAEITPRIVHARLAPRGSQLAVQSVSLEAQLEYPTASVKDLTVDPRLAHLGVRTRSVMTFVNLDGTSQMFEYTGNPGVLRMNPRWYHAAWQFIALGFEHILDGIDHLLFLLCLVLPFRKIRPLIGIVTAFTVAHSITLIASSVGWAPSALWFPPLVEVLIAGSIAWMALENILTATKDSTPAIERRWVMAFGFGLIHGFGFAFALRESLQFAGRHFALSLVSFNVGVEIGQVAVLCAAVPLLGLVYSRVTSQRVATIVISAFVTHAAWHWLTDRWSALRQYQFEWSLAGMLPLIRVMMATAILVMVAVIVGRLIRMRSALPRAEA